jgi:hypothetical protein
VLGYPGTEDSVSGTGSVCGVCCDVAMRYLRVAGVD